MHRKTYIDVSIIILIAITTFIQNVYPQNSYIVKDVVIEVNVDGSTLLKYKLIVVSPPTEISIPIPDDPLSYRVYDNTSDIPAYYNNHTISFYAVNEEVYVEVISLGLTDKVGVRWIFSVDMPFSYKLILPYNTIILNISRSDFSVSVEDDGRLSLLLPKGYTKITYTYPPEVSTPSGGGGAFPIYYILIPILGVLTTAIYLIFRRRRRYVKYSVDTNLLDERDKKILESLRAGPKTAYQLMELTDIPKSPLYRRLNKLIELGYVEALKGDGQKIYRLKEGDAE